MPTAAAPTLAYLARHGQSEWNNQSRVTGQADIGLSDKGRQQGEALAQCLKGEALDAIYARALRRTIDTAQPTATAQGLAIASLPALNEIHMGVLQGRLRLANYAADRSMDYAATLDPEHLAQRALAAMHEPLRYRPVETDGAARAALRIAQVLDNRGWAR